MARGLWGAAALMGCLYWASRQPGGLKGTWNRLRAAASDIQQGANPMEAGRRFVRGETAPAGIDDPALQGSYQVQDE